MKKNLFLIAITAIGLMACGGSTNKPETTENDSIADATAEVEEVAEKPAPTFISSDLKMFGLYGNVKEVSSIEVQGSTENNAYCRNIIEDRAIQFSNEGKWDKKGFSDLLDFVTKCNNDDFIASVSHRESDGTTYKNTITEFNDKGWAQKESYDEDGPCGLYKYKYTYEYPVIDNNGNWTERKVTVDAHTESYEDDSKTNKHSVFTVVRKITYYE